jgi:hypothetical protein
VTLQVGERLQAVREESVVESGRCVVDPKMGESSDISDLIPSRTAIYQSYGNEFTPSSSITDSNNFNIVP